MTPFDPDPARSCGGCTACCDGWLSADILGHEMKVGVPCHFRGEGGCTIYESRPDDPCRGFNCAWRLCHSPFPDELRPDRLGVIVLAKRWRGRIAYYLRPAGRDIDPSLLEWMRRMSIATGAPFLFDVNGHYRGYGSVEFQRDIADRVARGVPVLPGLPAGGKTPVRLMSLTSDAEAADGARKY